MEYCPHCMRPASGSRCPYCGGNMHWTGQVGIDLLVGSILTSGNGLRTYQLGAALGKGGFGITYAALEVNSHRRMAVKEYFPSYCAFRAGNGRDMQVMAGQEQLYLKGLNSFLEEAKMLLAQDDLPTLVKVVDFFQANGTAYLVMEFLDGVPLHRKMAELGGRFPAQLLLPTLPPLLADLGTLHARGVIHRDISPDNIMWMPDGTLKLLDFGSARSTNTGKSMTMQMKQGFSPIEQYTRRGQGAWTDVYALAATIYYCLTGVTPPASAERLEEDPIRMPNELGAGLTPQQEQALLHAMAVQPGNRTQSMEEFAQQLFWEEPPKQEVYIPAPPVPEPAQPVQPSISQQPQQPPVSQQTPQPQIPPSQQSCQQQGPSFTQRQTPSQPVHRPPKLGLKAPKEKFQTWCAVHNIPPKKLAIFGGIAVVLVALVVIILVLVLGRNDSPYALYDPNDHTASTNAPTGALVAQPTLPNIPPTTTEATEPTEDTAPDTIMVGDYQVRIIDENNATIVGFVGDEIGDMPIEAGGVPITAIADGAFYADGRGTKTQANISLPVCLKSIGANAFRNCSTLRMVYCFSNVTVGREAFSDTGLRCVILTDDNAKIRNPGALDNTVRILKRNISFEIDPDYNVDAYCIVDDIIYGWDSTEPDAIVMDLPSGLSTIEVPETILDMNGEEREVHWIEKESMKKVAKSVKIGLPSRCLFDPSLYESHPDTFYALESETISEDWIYLMRVVEAINDFRGGNAPNIQPAVDLTLAAYAMAQQEYTGGEVAGDLTWDDVMERFRPEGVAFGRCSYGTAPFSNLLMALATDDYAGPIPAEKSADYAGQFYNSIGLAHYLTEDGEQYWIILFVID